MSELLRSGVSLVRPAMRLSQTSTETVFWAKLTTGSYSDARYAFTEQTVSVGENGLLSFLAKTDGRTGIATNMCERGLGDGEHGVHGIFAKPSRVTTAPARYVQIHSAWDAGGNQFYWFDSPPFCFIESSNYYDVQCLDTGCPGDSSKWFSGVIPMAVLDDDDPPDECA